MAAEFKASDISSTVFTVNVGLYRYYKNIQQIADKYSKDSEEIDLGDVTYDDLRLLKSDEIGKTNLACPHVITGKDVDWCDFQRFLEEPDPVPANDPLKEEPSTVAAVNDTYIDKSLAELLQENLKMNSKEDYGLFELEENAINLDDTSSDDSSDEDNSDLYRSTSSSSSDDPDHKLFDAKNSFQQIGSKQLVSQTHCQNKPNQSFSGMLSKSRHKLRAKVSSFTDHKSFAYSVPKHFNFGKQNGNRNTCLDGEIQQGESPKCHKLNSQNYIKKCEENTLLLDMSTKQLEEEFLKRPIFSKVIDSPKRNRLNSSLPQTTSTCPVLFFKAIKAKQNKERADCSRQSMPHKKTHLKPTTLDSEGTDREHLIQQIPDNKAKDIHSSPRFMKKVLSPPRFMKKVLSPKRLQIETATSTPMKDSKRFDMDISGISSLGNELPKHGQSYHRIQPEYIDSDWLEIQEPVESKESITPHTKLNISYDRILPQENNALKVKATSFQQLFSAGKKHKQQTKGTKIFRSLGTQLLSPNKSRLERTTSKAAHIGGQKINSERVAAFNFYDSESSHSDNELETTGKTMLSKEGISLGRTTSKVAHFGGQGINSERVAAFNFYDSKSSRSDNEWETTEKTMLSKEVISGRVNKTVTVGIDQSVVSGNDSSDDSEPLTHTRDESKLSLSTDCLGKGKCNKLFCFTCM